MARLFVTHNGTRYEKKFRTDGTPFYMDASGNVLKESEVARVEEARRSAAQRDRRVVNLAESAWSPEKTRQRLRNAVKLREADRVARRMELFKKAGMSEKEAEIAANGRSAAGDPIC